LCVLLAQQKPAGSRIVAIADRGLLAERAKRLGLPLDLVNFNPPLQHRTNPACWKCCTATCSNPLSPAN